MVKHLKNNRARAFSLIELLIVLAVLAAIFSMTLVGYREQTANIKISLAAQQFGVLEQAMTTYYVEHINNPNDATHWFPYAVTSDDVNTGYTYFNHNFLNLTQLTAVTNPWGYAYKGCWQLTQDNNFRTDDRCEAPSSTKNFTGYYYFQTQVPNEIVARQLATQVPYGRYQVSNDNYYVQSYIGPPTNLATKTFVAKVGVLRGLKANQSGAPTYSSNTDIFVSCPTGFAAYLLTGIDGLIGDAATTTSYGAQASNGPYDLDIAVNGHQFTDNLATLKACPGQNGNYKCSVSVKYTKQYVDMPGQVHYLNMGYTGSKPTDAGLDVSYMAICKKN